MIKLLPEDVWSKIAAGEVVERPGSVVKELVENSIDGGAKRVRVSLWDGGKSRIVVEDDGAGIAFGDLPLAVAQHATSKLSAPEDLNSIFTLGYRGEAIASIASVSKLEIRSCPKNETGETGGGLIKASDGKILEHARTACARGTRVQIDELFFNMPARLKFLRASLSELRRCSSVLRDYALAWPGISFGLSHEGRTLFTTDGSGDKKRAVSQIWGSAPPAVTARTAAGNLSLECWYQPFPSRGRNEISAFVNGRAVNDPLIRAAVSNAGGGAGGPRDLSGNWALFITIDPSLIDVNIHPAKAEIRFRHTGEVFEAVREAARAFSGAPGGARLICANGGAEAGGAAPGQWQPLAPGRSGGAKFSYSMPSRPQNLFSRAAPPPDSLADAGEPVPAPARSRDGGSSWDFNENDTPADENAPRNAPDDVKFISRLGSGYLIFETASGLVIMDPHAAHERVMYERIMGESARGEGLTSQSLITPEPLQPTLALQVQEYEPELRSVGFSFRDEDGLFLTGVPSVLGGGSSPLSLLRATLAVWSEGGGSENGGKRGLDEQLTARWAESACKSSVKLTSGLHPDEAAALWAQLHACEQPNACPHGRPTMLRIEYAELTRHFERS